MSDEEAERFIEQTIRLAEKNARSGRGGPFAALVVRDGEVIAEGTNLVTSSNDPTAHAEIVAIRRACVVLDSFQLQDCDIFASCEPCPMCLGAIYWARSRSVYFAASRADAAAAGFDDAYIYEELDVTPEQRRLPMHRVRVESVLHPFEAWAANQRRTRY